MGSINGIVVQKKQALILIVIAVYVTTILFYLSVSTDNSIARISQLCDCHTDVILEISECQQLCLQADNPLKLPVEHFKHYQSATKNLNRLRDVITVTNGMHMSLSKSTLMTSMEKYTSKTLQRSSVPYTEFSRTRSVTQVSHKLTKHYSAHCHGCLSAKELVTVQKGWICSQPRLGNKMFMMAPAIVYAAKFNATFILMNGEDCEWSDWLRELFQSLNKSTPILQSSEIANWPNVGGSDSFHIPQVEYNFTISGYRQNWKYFAGSADAIALRHTFGFTEYYDHYAKTILSEVNSLATSSHKLVTVGVHVRIGDLLQDNRRKYGYQMANTSYYSKAMGAATERLTGHSNRLLFLVASDSPSKAKKMMDTQSNVYDIQYLNGTAFEDFAVLSKCDHSIMSGGTFGFWASWLAGGLTFYYPDFIRTDSELGKTFYRNDFYLPEWIPIEV